MFGEYRNTHPRLTKDTRDHSEASLEKITKNGNFLSVTRNSLASLFILLFVLPEVWIDSDKSRQDKHDDTGYKGENKEMTIP